MPGRTHLFLAMTPFGFGEAVMALRLARELAARGDRILFLGPSALRILMRDAPVRFGAIDKAWPDVARALTSVLAEQRCASVVLVDAAQVFLSLFGFGREAGFLERITAHAPVVALDMWNLPDTGLVWDTETRAWPIPAAAAALPRLLPVPLVRPDAGPGVMNALPAVVPGRRAALRARANLSERDRLIVMTSASWQAPAAQVHPYNVHIVRVIPPLIFRYLARLGGAVRVVHVGPAAFAGAETFTRYQHVQQLPPAEFQDLLGAADLLLTLNVTATTIASALRHDIPSVAVVSSRTAETAADLPAALADLAPLRPFRIWPLGLERFLTPVLRANPYLDAIDVVELLDEERFVSTCAALLGDPAAQASAAGRRAAYLARVDVLPRPADAFEDALANATRGR